MPSSSRYHPVAYTLSLQLVRYSSYPTNPNTDQTYRVGTERSNKVILCKKDQTYFLKLFESLENSLFLKIMDKKNSISIEFIPLASPYRTEPSFFKNTSTFKSDVFCPPLHATLH